MKGWWKYVACFAAGAALSLSVAYIFASRAGAKLNADLRDSRSALASASKINDGLAAANRLANDQLASANRLASDEQRTIAVQRGQLESQQRELANQQQLIAGQQQLIDAAKRGLAGIASSLASGLGDIRATAQGIADAVRRLYAIYHPGAS